MRYGAEEIDEAQKIQQLLRELGDPRIIVQKFLGIIYDHGNIYLVSQFIEGENMQDIITEYTKNQIVYPMSLFGSAEGNQLLDKIEALLRARHVDLEPRNIIIKLKEGRSYLQPDSVERMTLIDFETSK